MKTNKWVMFAASAGIAVLNTAASLHWTDVLTPSAAGSVSIAIGAALALAHLLVPIDNAAAPAASVKAS